jgi:PAS domain S-box-containing protein
MPREESARPSLPTPTLREQAEDALQQSERRFRALTERGGGFITLLDATGTVTYENPMEGRTLGFAAGELVGRNAFELVHPEDRPEVRRRFDQAIQQPGRAMQVEARVRARDESWHWLHIVATNLLDDPAVRGVVLNARNVTDRKQAEEALQYRLALEQLVAAASSRLANVPPAELDVAVNGVLADVGRLMAVDRCFVFRVSADVARADNTHEWCAPGIPSQIATLRNIPTVPFQWLLDQMHDGEPLSVCGAADLPPQAAAERQLFAEGHVQSVILVPIRHAGKLTGFVGADAVRAERHWSEDDIRFVRTIGELLADAQARCQAEQALRASEERYRLLAETLEQQVAERTQALRDNEERLRAIVNTAADAIIMIDDRGRIGSFNPAAEHMFDYRAEEVLGQNVKVLMPAPQAEQHDDYLRRYLQTGEPHLIGTRREVEGRRKTGATFPGELAINELHDGPRLFVAILRDISDRKELQAELLRSAEDEQRRIGQELHDDVQQQLTGLGLLTQSLVDALASPAEGRSSDPEDLHKLAARIARGLGDANRHLHLLSRGLIPVEVDAHGLQAALMELASRTRHAYPVGCRFAWEHPVRVADSFVATHLYRIAQEAVNNALKHSGADRIELNLREAHGMLTLEVLDNGVGIDTPSIPAAGAVGRGLRIMAHRASLLGAAFRVEPAERGGTLVSCVLRERGKALTDAS